MPDVEVVDVVEEEVLTWGFWELYQVSAAALWPPVFVVLFSATDVYQSELYSWLVWPFSRYLQANHPLARHEI